MISQIQYKSEILAIIVSSNHESDGIEVFTPENFSQQLGYMKRAKGYVIKPLYTCDFETNSLHQGSSIY